MYTLLWNVQELKVQFRKFYFRYVSMKAHKGQIRELIETKLQSASTQ